MRLYAKEAALPPLPPRSGRLAGGAIACEDGSCTVRPSLNGPTAVLLRGDSPKDACAGAALVVSAEPVRGRCAARVVDRFSVWRDGAHAVWLEPAGPRVLSDRAALGAAYTPASQRGHARTTAAARARFGMTRPGPKPLSA